MKRLWFGSALLAIVLALSLWSGVAMGLFQEHLAQEMEAAGKLPLQEGIAAAQQTQTKWEHRWKGIAVVTDHEPMEAIDGLFALLEVYGKNGQQEAFAACCAHLSQELRALGDAHTPTPWNLF